MIVKIVLEKLMLETKKKIAAKIYLKISLHYRVKQESGNYIWNFSH